MDVFVAQTSRFADLPVLLLMGLSILFILYLTFRKRAKNDPLNRPFRVTLQQQKALERDMQNVVVELSEMARQMTAQLETRAAKLEMLIQEADAKLARLSAAVNGEEPTTKSLDQPAAPSSPSPPLRLVKDDMEDRWAEVYMLADQGLSTAQIAARLNRPEGEIDLILHIRPKSQRPAEVDVSEPPIVSAG